VLDGWGGKKNLQFGGGREKKEEGEKRNKTKNLPLCAKEKGESQLGGGVEKGKEKKGLLVIVFITRKKKGGGERGKERKQKVYHSERGGGGGKPRPAIGRGKKKEKVVLFPPPSLRGGRGRCQVLIVTEGEGRKNQLY